MASGLRPISAPTIQATVKRPGVGVCLTGFGCPGTKWQAGHFQHEVFYLPTTETSGLLGDPMAPHGAKPELVPSSTMVAWAKGVAPNDGREVRRDEFGGDMDAATLLPLVTCTVLPGGTLYGDPNRGSVIAVSWSGGTGIGLYAMPLPVTSGKQPLAPIRISDKGGANPRVGWVGRDKVTNIVSAGAAAAAVAAAAVSEAKGYQ